MFTIIRRNKETYCVGFFDPSGEFTIVYEYEHPNQAAAMVSYLNGGLHPDFEQQLRKLLECVIVKVDFMNCTRDRKGH